MLHRWQLITLLFVLAPLGALTIPSPYTLVFGAALGLIIGILDIRWNGPLW